MLGRSSPEGETTKCTCPIMHMHIHMDMHMNMHMHTQTQTHMPRSIHSALLWQPLAGIIQLWHADVDASLSGLRHTDQA